MKAVVNFVRSNFLAKEYAQLNIVCLLLLVVSANAADKKLDQIVLTKKLD